MKHIKNFENVIQRIKNKFNPKKGTIPKSDYTYEISKPSKIDPSVDVSIETWMVCPICKNTLKDMYHGEIQKFNKCKTKLQVFGNALHVNDINNNPFSSNEEKYPWGWIKTGVEYNDIWIKEKLTKSDYTRGNQMYCPLCKHTLDKIEHGETKICPDCTLKMTNYGNALDCEIDKKNLEYYRDITKYNL